MVTAGGGGGGGLSLAPLPLLHQTLPGTVTMSLITIGLDENKHSVIFPRGVVHRVENGWGLTKVAAVLLNGLLW